MFFISNKKFKEMISLKVKESIQRYFSDHCEEDRKHLEERISFAIKNMQREELKAIFDKWIESALEDVTKTHEIRGLHKETLYKHQYTEPSIIKSGFQKIITELFSSMQNSLLEINRFTTQEEFIDGVIERINKKQIGK